MEKSKEVESLIQLLSVQRVHVCITYCMSGCEEMPMFTLIPVSYSLQFQPEDVMALQECDSEYQVINLLS
jgi:hypothetical protein